MGGTFVSLIPEKYMDPEKKSEFFMWLMALPVDIWTKKYIALDWAREVGIVLTEDDINRITGGRAAETRG
ncbi:MAG: hypothetical protein DSO07_11980 [Thermoproteota archaeon]|nr:MAG: hypothetical protein DSO07_11980 [Candidatus Korarchaeota archaeon]